MYRAEIIAQEEEQLRRVLAREFPLGKTVVLPERPAGVALPDSPPTESPRVTWREDDGIRRLITTSRHRGA